MFSQVIQLRGRLGGILNLLTGMLGGGNKVVERADMAVEKLQGYKERMVREIVFSGVHIKRLALKSETGGYEDPGGIRRMWVNERWFLNFENFGNVFIQTHFRKYVGTPTINRN